MHEITKERLAEQARRVELLLDAAPDDACPPDLGDFVSEVEKLLKLVDTVCGPAPKPTDPTEAIKLDDSYEAAKIEHVEINLPEGTKEPA